ncbi:RDD family protein [Camelimonas sp. ID_303_24]
MKQPAQVQRERIEQFTPPEGVPVNFVITSPGARLGAQCLDLLLTGLAVTIFAALLAWSNVLPSGSGKMVIVLLAFLLRVPYYVLSELVWNGRTPGKRIVGVRVINMNGRRLTPHQVTARNLMKEVEFFTPLTMVVAAPFMSGWGIGLTLVWVLTIMIIPFANQRRQRLGDMIAGTLVVDNPRTTLLPDLAASLPRAEAATVARFDFHPDHLNVYGRYELQTLEDVLRNLAGGANAAETARIARTIIRKTGYNGPAPAGQERAFLIAFYRAQREHLETLRLFGTSREDKHHLTAPGPASGSPGAGKA